MWYLKACTVCLSTEGKLFDMDDCGQRGDYNSVARLNSYGGDGLLNYLCVECSAYVRRFKKFQTKCQRANFLLQEMLDKNKQIDQFDVSAINRETLDLMPTLGYWKTELCRYEEVKFKWVEYNRININKNNKVPLLSVTITGNFDSTTPSNPASSDGIAKDRDDIKIEIVDNLQSATNYVEFDISNVDNNQLIFNERHNSDVYCEVPCADGDSVDDDVNFDSGGAAAVVPVEVGTPCDGADGSTLDEEYANVYPLSQNEQKVVTEVYKLFSHGKYKCDICQKGYHNEARLKVHTRMHEKHVSGVFFCKFCSFYYKTEFLLKTHMTEKHYYKYVCPKCPEVSFDRTSAKQHYIWAHLQKGHKKNANWYDSRPTWVSTRGGKRTKGVSEKKGVQSGVVTLTPVKKMKKIPKDFLIYTPVGHLEQYQLINERRKSKNYTESAFKCELCFRGFREVATFNNHLKKHDPTCSGPLVCDICKLNFNNTRKMYKHMIITHLFRYSCQLCKFVCYNRGQAYGHYRWHKNVTYPCPHCDMEFTKSSTRLTHIRIKHPSTDICNLCGHSFVSETGLYFHMRKTHTKEEIELSEKLLAQQVTEKEVLYCGDCKIHFISEQAFQVHLGSSNKHSTVNLSVQPGKSRAPRPTKPCKRVRRTRGPTEILNNGVATATVCEECGKHLPNDVQARKHYKTEHPGAEFLKRYMCDVCGHTTQQYNNLLVHMRTHTNEKPYACHFCDRRFSMPSNRDRHLVVHTGEKRYECSHCHRRFTQSSAVKLHVQTVHLKIPYAPWDKKNRRRRREPDLPAAAPEPKLLVEAQGEYLSAYISYHDEGV